MKNLMLGQIPSDTQLSLDLPRYDLIQNMDQNFVSFGSCFALFVSHGLWRTGFSTFYKHDVCFHYSPKSIAQFLNQLELPLDELEKFIIKSKDGMLRATSIRHQRATPTIREFCTELHEKNKEVLDNIRKSDFVIITLGTVTYQRDIENGTIISHGGGLPKGSYEIKQPDVEETQSDIENCVQIIRRHNPNCKIIFTVSPQRYGWMLEAKLSSGIQKLMRDSVDNATNWLITSNLDKYKLRIALDNLLKSTSENGLFYFPAFEIVMDELRLYESFNHDTNDFLHINAPSTSNYVINRFLNSFCNTQMKEAMEFFRETIDVRIDGYPDLISKMGKAEATKYITDKLSVVSKHVKQVGCFRLASYIVPAMYNVFPDITETVIAENQHHELLPFIETHIDKKSIEVNKLSDETPVVIIGVGPELEHLVKTTNLLNKNVVEIISFDPAPPTKLYGVPVSYYMEATKRSTGAILDLTSAFASKTEKEFVQNYCQNKKKNLT